MTYSKFHFHTVFTDAANQLAPAKTSSIRLRVNFSFPASLDHTADKKPQRKWGRMERRGRRFYGEEF